MSKLLPSSQLQIDEKIIYTMNKVYLNELTTQFEVKPFNNDVFHKENIRALQIKSCSYDKDDIISSSFKKVLNIFANDVNSLAIVFNRTVEKTEMFLLIKNSEEKASGINTSINLLQDSIQGNFPGIEIESVDDINKSEDDSTHSQKVTETLGFSGMNAISYLVSTPSEKSDAHNTQNIERLLNGMVPKDKDEEYAVVILAEAIPYNNIWSILGGYEELATYLYPQVNIQKQYGINESTSTGVTITESIANSLGKAIGSSTSHNFGFFGGIGVGIGYVGGSYGYNTSTSETDTTSTSNTTGTSSSESTQTGTSQNVSLNYKNYKQANMLERIEQDIVRIKQGQATGLWHTSTYIFAKTPRQSKNVTHFYNSLNQNDTQYNESFFTQTWNSQNHKKDFEEVTKYITHFCHPVLVPKKENLFSYDGEIKSSSMLTTAELSMLYSLPRNPIQGIPVFKHIRFGREPYNISKEWNTDKNKQIDLGFIQHLGKTEKTRVSLDKDELTKHIFIAGSTGSGKSNTIYKIISEVCPLNGNTKFMIIEPAKGEYKNIFGGRDDVKVYGTNPYKSPNLLQINPFYFPEDIHILEHIDRLVEVFNACWPMYAAMPAILKESIEKSYQDSGWNLSTSKIQGDRSFPSFQTLLKVLPEIIEKKDYSGETKGDYIGALHTRILSLTTGLYGQIFDSSSDLCDLFNENVIVDLSRIGSQETKALLIGVLLLHLQEYRASENRESNGELRHITILEEAHTLLKHQPSQEGANLQSKSIEMFANSIAEMRTYGQGFIIADQSPGLLDMSVIRNTNTKIILRLPSLEDRELVGYAAGLDTHQIEELSKLECGVAAISHSSWVEPILCKVDKFEDFNGLRQQNYEWQNPQNILFRKFINKVFDIGNIVFSGDECSDIRKWIDSLCLKQDMKNLFLKVLENASLSDKEKLNIIRNIIKIELHDDTCIQDIKNTLYYLYEIEDSDKIVKEIETLVNKILSEE